MNDPKDIVLKIKIEKEEKKEKEEEVSSEHSIVEEENKDMLYLNEEARFNNLYFHLKENLSKKLYKKTIKEIEVLIDNKYIESYSQLWKILILKIRAILKIIQKKIVKYLINHYEKVKIKHHILSIKKYFNKIPNEFNYFFEKIKESKIINDMEIVDGLLLCYFDYIYLISFFHKKIGNVMESISYLSLIIRLYKETQLVVKSFKTIYKMEKCFIFLSQMLIYNEDFFSCLEFLNIAMDICLTNLIFQSDDLTEGIFQGDKNKITIMRDTTNLSINKIKIQNEIENSFGDKKLKKIFINIVFIYFYRAICYENIGKIKNSIKCYYQCLWFLNHFFVVNYKDLSGLIENILNKSIDFKNAVDYLDKKVKYLDHIQLKLKNLNKKGNKDEKNSKFANNLYPKKYQLLANKIEKIKINEIDTVNKFDTKKNIKGLNLVKREGKDKNIFLSNFRLLNSYLREDFRVIIDKMNKIKSFDMDYQTRDKIQKYIRKIYFDQNQEKIKNTQINKNNNKLLSSVESFKVINNNKNSVSYVKNNRYDSINNFQNSFKKVRINSAFIREPNNKILAPSRSWKSFSRNQSIGNYKKIKLNISFNKDNGNKNEIIQKSKPTRINSACACRKIKIYEENKELNGFFNKKYIEKRNYIKKLQDRELIFQKSILRLKNTPKNPMPFYNKELIRQNAKASYQYKMALLIGTPVYWKENLSVEEIKKVKSYDKLQNAVINSLDNNAFTKYKEEEKKQKVQKINNSNEFNWSVEKANNNNKNIIDKLNMGLEKMKQREIIENKNFIKLLKENRKHIKFRNERNQYYSSNSGINIRNNRSEDYSRNFYFLKKSYSSPYFY